LRVLADQSKLTIVGQQDQAVAVPVLADLRGRRDAQDLLVERFHLDDAALGKSAFAWAAVLELLGREQAEVWLAATDVAELPDAEHLRFQVAADGVQEVLERPVVGTLGRGGAGRMTALHVDEIGLDGSLEIHTALVCPLMTKGCIKRIWRFWRKAQSHGW
jgi:hypothetical protein